eukprot:CAMPEP_0172577232 /NCGR_PEP_ID=MMETSP1067-20121228/138127_1 /TAXON_ID=265564 ORGANISM="Thalassiosira punctigera, Strain Tpunct2005C2" /NCGR_SAMPLE_ID=MMETSP1067 /ASSEMBLY_ACC=CAM_ASM_000444 /LENGTH=716 /DNA_ID=CAMNT_0013369917 /DNA_START=290 /DNA_END=2440 /DNA_ORIENTATION=-
MTGQCDNGPTVTQGVFEIFRTAEECCMSSYPDPSSCYKAPPTASPSLAPALATAPPTPVPQKVALGQVQKLVPTPAPHEVAPRIDNDGVLLTPIPIIINNLPSQFELDDDRRGELIDIIQNTLIVTSDDFNVTILEMVIADRLFSDQDRTLPLELQITVTGTIIKLRSANNVFPDEVRVAFVNAMQNQINEITDGLERAWNLENATSNVTLTIGDVQIPSPPTHGPTFPNLQSGVVAETPNANNDARVNMSMPIWAVVLVAILFTMLCGGLSVWRRRRDKNIDRQTPDHNSFFDGGVSSNASSSRITAGLSPSVEDALASRPRKIHVVDSSFNRSRNMDQSFNQSCGMDKSLTMSRLMNHSSNQSHQMKQRSNQSRLMNESFNQSRHSQTSQSFKSHRMCQSVDGQNINRERGKDHSLNQSCHTDPNWSCNRRRWMEPRSNKSLRLMEWEDENINRVQIDPPERDHDEECIVDPVYQVGQHVLSAGNQGQISQEEELDEGYEGGKSSFFMSSNHVSEDDEDSSDQDQGIEADESEDNVLGLLYYADASSADESAAKDCGKSRRSGRAGRSGRSGRSRYSSGKSTRQSSGKSSKQKKQGKKRVIKKHAEERGYELREQQQQQHTHPEYQRREQQKMQHPGAFLTNTVGEPEGQHAYVTRPGVSGSMVYVNTASTRSLSLHKGEFLPSRYAESPPGEQSVSTHGSTIRTDDTYRKAFA